MQWSSFQDAEYAAVEYTALSLISTTVLKAKHHVFVIEIADRFLKTCYCLVIIFIYNRSMQNNFIYNANNMDINMILFVINTIKKWIDLPKQS